MVVIAPGSSQVLLGAVLSAVEGDLGDRIAGVTTQKGGEGGDTLIVTSWHRDR